MNFPLLTRLSKVPHQYLLDISIFHKMKKLSREEDIACLIEVIDQVVCLMEIYASIQAFVFARCVIGSTRRCTIVDKFVVIILKRIMTPSFVFLDMFVF